jgi:hypothetical protein
MAKKALQKALDKAVGANECPVEVDRQRWQYGAQVSRVPSLATIAMPTIDGNGSRFILRPFVYWMAKVHRNLRVSPPKDTSGQGVSGRACKRSPF